ncbi:MAG: hypothetical protein P4L85_14370 [Paludisphaera borealis]|uniref:hypothetical protein n=1 Tax=Paludisphaera borealis TaxID=1387353 RepID=UPI00284AD0AE|nr:hypothetical protein [Paludisphaera borealis]MDR3620532.1 hypothetical protein [Paludisphaera borealis]
MTEPDDRLAGDLVWELFPAEASESETSRARILHGLEAAFLVVLTWFLYQPLSVALACLAISLKDFREGWRLARTIPNKAGGTICSLFTYSWGAWKIGVAAFAALFVLGALNVSILHEKGMFPGAAAAMLLVPCGFLTSMILTAVGLVQVLRSGMHVWLGEGMNQVKTPLFGMIILGFTFFVIGPMCFWFPPAQPGSYQRPEGFPFALIGFFACLFGGPIVILVLYEWACDRILADQPGKFGPKVPAVGKWDK